MFVLALAFTGFGPLEAPAFAGRVCAPARCNAFSFDVTSARVDVVESEALRRSLTDFEVRRGGGWAPRKEKASRAV
eukprot:10492166-Alexandrium_andersonii.AAC.1